VVAADKSAEILIYGIIGADVTGQQVADQLASIPEGSDLVVRINSRGGDVFEGVAILNALRGFPGKVTTVVDGIAASAASFIAMAGSEVVMNRNSEMMIHNGSSYAMGGAEAMRKMADNLERTNANIASMYAEKAGGTADEWRTAMAAETWYSADEAVKAGLADRVEAIKGRDASAIKAHFDLTVFAHAGRQAAPAPRIPVRGQPSTAPVEVTNGKEPIVATLNKGLAELFGIDADADDETILAAAKEALDERASDDVPAPPAEPSIEQATQIAAKAGLSLVNSDTLTALQAQARQGAEARAQQVRESHERIVNSAVAEGRIVPASRDHWLQQLAVDPVGITNVIASLPAVVPLAEVGHGVSNEITNEDDALYASLFGKDA
jgi:ATP-dependent protease ClpP protease subunit